MHEIQEKLLALSKRENIAELSLRSMAEKIGMKDESPQKIKHHLGQLEKKGFFTINRNKGIVQNIPQWLDGKISKKVSFLSIPIIGIANCGPANVFAETNFQGFLKVSGRVLNRKKSEGLFAVKADGSSMNNAEIGKKKLEDGDFAIIDSSYVDPSNKDIVLAIIDGKATIKRYINDKANHQIVLMADSSYNYEPIYLHPEDEFSINGKVVDIIKKPNLK